MSYPVGLQGIGNDSQDAITDALIRRAFSVSGVGDSYVGALSIPVDGIVGAEDLAGLSIDDLMLLNEVAEAQAAGVGAVLPSLAQRFNLAMQAKPKLASVAVAKGIVKPAAGMPAIPVRTNPGASMQANTNFSPQSPTILGLVQSGPTELPITSNGTVAAGLPASLQIRTNFPIRGTGFVFSESTRGAFSIANPSIGGVNVFANTQEVEADIYPPDATYRTLFPTLDTAQTLDMIVRNRSGAPVSFNGVLKGEAARPK